MTVSTAGTEYVDVAIIGAGVSGLYSGWRLLTDRSNPNLWLDAGRPQVAIYELSERVGGRLFSVTDLPGLPNVVGELGGMRYMEHQRLVSSLIQELGLPSIPFPMGDTSRNLFYLRRDRFTDQGWTDPAVHKPYAIDPEYQNRHPDDLFSMVVDRVLAANGQSRPTDRQGWDAIKHILRYYQGPDKGYLLEHVGFWNLLMDQLGNEGYELLAQGGGYYSNTINWNSAEALPYIVGDFGGAIEYKTLEGGFDQIARGLESAYRTAGGMIRTSRMLVNFRHNDHSDPDSQRYRYQLFLRDPAEPNTQQVVYANRIILAMPRRSLELLSQDNFLFASGTELDVISNVRSVIGEPSFKLLMGFYEEGQTEPWWQRRLGLESGRSITDLPMRQCYYFGTDPETRHSLLLASYNDMSTVDYWKVLEDPNGGLLRFRMARRLRAVIEQGRFEPRATPAASRQALQQASESYPQAPRRMVEHSLAQLKELHDLPDTPEGPQIPEPYTTAFMNWNDDPYGGGYHAWKANYDVGATMQFMRRPQPGEAVHICGEAYSDQQGWVEGAFCIAELMLREHFGLTTPPWLAPQDYYLGR